MTRNAFATYLYNYNQRKLNFWLLPRTENKTLCILLTYSPDFEFSIVSSIRVIKLMVGLGFELINNTSFGSKSFPHEIEK